MLSFLSFLNFFGVGSEMEEKVVFVKLFWLKRYFFFVGIIESVNLDVIFLVIVCLDNSVVKYKLVVKLKK